MEPFMGVSTASGSKIKLRYVLYANPAATVLTGAVCSNILYTSRYLSGLPAFSSVICPIPGTLRSSGPTI